MGTFPGGEDSSLSSSVNQAFLLFTHTLLDFKANVPTQEGRLLPVALIYLPLEVAVNLLRPCRSALCPLPLRPHPREVPYSSALQ